MDNLRRIFSSGKFAAEQQQREDDDNRSSYWDAAEEAEERQLDDDIASMHVIHSRVSQLDGTEGDEAALEEEAPSSPSSGDAPSVQRRSSETGSDVSSSGRNSWKNVVSRLPSRKEIGAALVDASNGGSSRAVSPSLHVRRTASMSAISEQSEQQGGSMPCESARSSFDSSRFSSTMDKGASESPPVSLRVDGPDVSAEPSLPSPKMNAAGALSALGPPPTALQSVTPGLNIAVPPSPISGASSPAAALAVEQEGSEVGNRRVSFTTREPEAYSPSPHSSNQEGSFQEASFSYDASLYEGSGSTVMPMDSPSAGLPPGMSPEPSLSMLAEMSLTPNTPTGPDKHTYEKQQKKTRIKTMVDIFKSGPTILERIERNRRGHRSSTITMRPTQKKGSPSRGGRQQLQKKDNKFASSTSSSQQQQQDDAEKGNGAPRLSPTPVADSMRSLPESCTDSQRSAAGYGLSRQTTRSGSTSTSLRGIVHGSTPKSDAAENHLVGHQYESYQIHDDSSRVHLEMSAQERSNHQLVVLWVEIGFVMLIGCLLAIIAAAIFYFESYLVTGRRTTISMAFSPCQASPEEGWLSWWDGSCSGGADEQARTRDDSMSLGRAYAAYTLYNTGLIFLASSLTYCAPMASASGLPPLKAFLNGVSVPNLLTFSTLVAKVVGVTCVVATGLPLGREGPMVHTGAIVAARVTRFTFKVPEWMQQRWGWPRKITTPLQSRVPSAQINWIGVGCAAGVAAAFNAPLGGILYSFEEVCTHWDHKLTWRAFFCVVVAAVLYNALISTDGVLLNQGLVLELDLGGGTKFETGYYLALIVLGILGGLTGATYVKTVVFFNGLRRKYLGPSKKRKVAEATLMAFLVFTVLFWVPLAFDCRDGGSGDGYGGNATAYNGSGSSSGYAGRRSLGDGVDYTSSLPLASMRRVLAGGGSKRTEPWQCPLGQYNPMANLLHTGQEGVILHLFERRDSATASGSYGGSSSGGSSSGDYGDSSNRRSLAGASVDVSLEWFIVLPFILIYFVLAVSIFGIFVPAGNFIPALTIGAALGRLFGILLNDWGVFLDTDPGWWSLMGAASVLGGVTRMTLTLAVILAEVTDDAKAMLPMMFVLTAAKIVGDLISPSFDHAMMHLWELPYLEAEPLHEFEHLIARDVMRPKVYVLPERMLVGNLVRVLKGTPHHGYPIVSVDGLAEEKPFFAGLILRRQLLVLVKERVWEVQSRDEWLAPEAMRRYVDSAFKKDEIAKLEDVKLSVEDMEAQIDLRPFMDPSPYVVSDLMPLTRIQHFFCVIGVRHLTVIDCREEVVGVITRKDILTETIEERLMQAAERLLVSEREKKHGRRGSQQLKAATLEVAKSHHNLAGGRRTVDPKKSGWGSTCLGTRDGLSVVRRVTSPLSPGHYTRSGRSKSRSKSQSPLAVVTTQSGTEMGTGTRSTASDDSGARTSAPEGRGTSFSERI